MAKINVQVVLSALEDPIKRATRPIATKIANDKFEIAKKNFLDAFLDNPVSQELKEGSSSTTSQIIDKGSLFGFIGFDEGKDPIGELYDYLNNNISIDENASYNRSTKEYEFAIKIPSKEDIKAVTPMPFGTSKSWVFSIETGISGLNRYLFKVKYGRSGAGVQVKNPLQENIQYRPQKYMSSLLNFLYNSLE